MVIRSSKSGMAAIVMIVMAGIGTIASAAPPKKPTAKPAASAAPSASPAPSAAGTAAALDTTDKWTQGPGTGCADHYYRPPNTTTAVPCGAAHSCCTRTASTAGNQIGMAICVDTKRTDFACGGCGRSCQETESCVDGLCTCGAGKVRCGKECIDITGDDGTNCGACGKVCPQICKSGKCTTCAKEGLGTYCGTKQEGHCADLSQADDDCGKCGRACNSGKSCYGGKCL